MPQLYTSRPTSNKFRFYFMYYIGLAHCVELTQSNLVRKREISRPIGITFLFIFGLHRYKHCTVPKLYIYRLSNERYIKAIKSDSFGTWNCKKNVYAYCNCGHFLCLHHTYILQTSTNVI